MKKHIQIISALLVCLAFASCNTTTEPTGGKGFAGHIYYTNANEISRIRLSDETVELLMRNASQPDVMANGNIVAVENIQGRIMITDITGANRTTLVSWLANGGYRAYFGSPRISYDQKYVAYDGDNVYNPITYVVDAQTGDLISTIGVENNSNENYYAPSWAPDGSLFVQGEPTRNNGIYKIDKDFTSITRVDPNLTNVSYPNVSPDGTKIAFIRDQELWTMNIDGTNATQLKTDLYQLYSPTWSPDSKYIAVTSQGKLHIIDPKALTITKISQGFTNESQLCWK